MNLLINSKEDNNEQRLYQTGEDGIVCGTTFKIKNIYIDEFRYDGHLFLTAKHCVEEYDEKMFYSPIHFKENTGEYLPLTVFSTIDKNTFCPTYPDLIVKHPKLDIAAIIIPKVNWSYLGNAGIVSYKKYDIGHFDLSKCPNFLKMPVFRNKYNKGKKLCIFVKILGKVSKFFK